MNAKLIEMKNMEPSLKEIEQCVCVCVCVYVCHLQATTSIRTYPEHQQNHHRLVRTVVQE